MCWWERWTKEGRFSHAASAHDLFQIEVSQQTQQRAALLCPEEGKKKTLSQSSRLYTCKVIKVVLRRENENMGDVTVRWHQGAARYYIEHQVFINVVCVCVCV
jgi:hypothetical protein